MPLYESRKNAENRITLKPEWRDAVSIGPDAVMKAILQRVAANHGKNRALRMAFDGWYGIDWPSVIAALESQAAAAGLKISFRAVLGAFKSREEIAAYQARIYRDCRSRVRRRQHRWPYH